MKISELKKEAKVKLIGKWPLAIGINLTYLILTIALSYVSTKIDGIVGSTLALIFAIITIPLSFGITASMLNLSRNETVGVTDFITIGFKNFKKAIFLSLSIFFRIIIPVIILAFSAALSIISGFANAVGSSVASSGITSIVSLLLAVASMIWIIYKVLSYALSTYVLIDNDEMKSSEAIAKSCELMKGNKLKFVGLVFSFIGWFFLCGFLAGMTEIVNVTLGTIVMYGLSLLLTPYITFAEINFYEDLAGVSEAKVEVSEEPSEQPSAE